MGQISILAIQNQINLGRAGHCFKSYWGGRDHIFQLISVTGTGEVSILENGQPGIVSFLDMVGLEYLGVTCPSSWSSPGSTTNPTTGWPPKCGFVMTP
ncbi:hypothetical protein [Bacillus sp. AY18-3]|uniref:hypothetical protein n=1 Tax=Bacillus sp. AY18-3 TaxID=2217814 RepID=UPI0011C8B894|nr:hypothetical protein [Bacillus sp. AY18-3]